MKIIVERSTSDGTDPLTFDSRVYGDDKKRTEKAAVSFLKKMVRETDIEIGTMFKIRLAPEEAKK